MLKARSAGAAATEENPTRPQRPGGAGGFNAGPGSADKREPDLRHKSTPGCAVVHGIVSVRTNSGSLVILLMGDTALAASGG